MKGDRVFGTGVNVAARLEALADAGGIALRFLRLFRSESLTRLRQGKPLVERCHNGATRMTPIDVAINPATL
jgi:hypothetical protein